MAQRRIVQFSEVLNFRDLGGYQTYDSRVTRWGTIYRSDTLQRLTESDLELFRELQISVIVDLRSPSEVRRLGRGLLESEPIRFINASVLPSEEVRERPDDLLFDDDYLASRYLHYLDVGSESFVRAIQAMSVCESYPMVFNCYLGKDRTGVLAALLLGCLNVNRTEIIDDYALSASRVPALLDKLRQEPVTRKAFDRSNPLLFTAHKSTMSRFLDGLDERYGGARKWAISVGVSPTQLDSLGQILLGESSLAVKSQQVV